MIKVGLLGCGTVGGGVVHLLRANAAYIEARVGVPIDTPGGYPAQGYPDIATEYALVDAMARRSAARTRPGVSTRSPRIRRNAATQPC